MKSIKKKVWLKVLIIVVAAILVLMGILFIVSQRMVVKYGTPSYRPKIE